MDTRLARPPARTQRPDATAGGPGRRDLPLLLGATSVCVVVGLVATWSLLLGPPDGYATIVTMIAVLALWACAGGVSAVRSLRRGSSTTPAASTPLVGSGDGRVDTSERT